MKRDQLLETLQTSPDVDVLIIGGGINGIGTFRDLALQGLRVLLVEDDAEVRPRPRHRAAVGGWAPGGRARL